MDKIGTLDFESNTRTSLSSFCPNSGETLPNGNSIDCCLINIVQLSYFSSSGEVIDNIEKIPRMVRFIPISLNQSIFNS